MSAVTIYDISIPLFANGMKTILNVLTKASTHADAASLPSTRLFDDMHPLSFQVQSASNTAKKAVFRLTGSAAAGEPWADDETTMEQLVARIERTLKLLDSVKPEDLAGKETQPVELGLGSKGTVHTNGKDYVLSYAIPNFFFHVQTAYSILRMKGVPVGKSDYLRAFMQKVKPDY